MTLVFCVDDRMGLAFNRRRQSRDRTVSERIAAGVEGMLWCADEASRRLFAELGCDTGLYDGTVAAEDALFVELEDPQHYEAQADRILLFRWNRQYPADVRCTIDFTRWTRVSHSEFPGRSHDCITQEEYIREA